MQPHGMSRALQDFADVCIPQMVTAGSAHDVDALANDPYRFARSAGRGVPFTNPTPKLALALFRIGRTRIRALFLDLAVGLMDPD